jgi:hypothetical protein
MPLNHKIVNYKNIKHQFLDALPNQFNRQTYLEVAKRCGIIPKTAEKYVTDFVKNEILNRPI